MMKLELEVFDVSEKLPTLLPSKNYPPMSGPCLVLAKSESDWKDRDAYWQQGRYHQDFSNKTKHYWEADHENIGGYECENDRLIVYKWAYLPDSENVENT